jgi:nitroreductase
MNYQEIDIYVLLKTGAYVYDAKDNKLILVTPEDLRGQAINKPFSLAPVQLVFIADLSKEGNGPVESKLNTANIDCGYISQNTYLFCTSEGLVTGARGTVNRDPLIAKLKLRADQKILLAHSVGFPKP